MENRFIYLRKKIFILRRLLGRLPYQKIFKKLYKDIENLNTWNALDLFAGDAMQSSLDVKKYINDIELWDIDPKFEPKLKNIFPSTTIRIVDSFNEIHSVRKKYNIIFIDNWPRISYGHCEHFDLFPKVYDLLKNQAVVVILTMPEINKVTFFSDKHMQLRRKFYNIENATMVSMDSMVLTYEHFANQHGFTLKDWFCVDRWFMYKFTKWFRVKKLCFLVLHLEK